MAENRITEQGNIELVKEFVEIAYDPKRASARAVAHLCAPNNRFIAPTTLPGVNTFEEYAENLSQFIKQVNDLHLVSFDVLFAGDDRVCLRYTIEGTHSGEPHGDIQPTGKRARWSAAALFRAENGKLTEFIKEWNKLALWEQLGWPVEECLSQRQRRAG